MVIAYNKHQRMARIIPLRLAQYISCACEECASPAASAVVASLDDRLAVRACYCDKCGSGAHAERDIAYVRSAWRIAELVRRWEREGQDRASAKEILNALVPVMETFACALIGEDTARIDRADLRAAFVLAASRDDQQMQATLCEWLAFRHVARIYADIAKYLAEGLISEDAEWRTVWQTISPTMRLVGEIVKPAIVVALYGDDPENSPEYTEV